MRLYILTALCLLICYAQAHPPRPYFQQEVNYNIQVQLDDKHHILHGKISMEYINHSPDTLHYIYIHLWPNAYANNNTPFAKQLLENRKTSFYYAADSNRGYVNGMAFTVDDAPVTFTIDSAKALDICLLKLPKPLLPGAKINIATPFTVKIPFIFSRMGHVGRHYEISQWYPKPAVYDNEGWHPISYLDQGEFYSEFGSFNVSITLPGTYKVGATGELQDSRLKELLSTPSDNPALVTWHYTAKRVHDFAWFADQNFTVKHSIFYTSTHPVDIFIFQLYNQNTAWQLADTAVARALKYYGRRLGEYPYNTCSVVQGYLQAGGGMEYPTITVIGKVSDKEELDDVIVHEVGHNWLYGVLAFNERRYPWMDEGINSYYETQLIQDWYGKKYAPGKKNSFASFIGLNNFYRGYDKYLTYYIAASAHTDQPCNLPAEDYTNSNYNAIIYSKVPLILQYLQAYLGTDTFDARMQAFYKQHAFTHPQPYDFEDAFKTNSGKELDWFFDQLMTKTYTIDYSITHAKDTVHIGNYAFQKITVCNKGKVKGPYSISAMRGDTAIKTVWYGGFYGKMQVLFPYGDYSKYIIDAAWDMPEINKRNNTISAGTTMRAPAPLAIKLFGRIDNPAATALYISPALGYNTTDKLQIGVVLYNHILAQRPIEYTLIPLYSIGTGTFNFTGNVTTRFYTPNSLFQSISPGLNAETFSYTRDYLTNTLMSYTRINPYIDFLLKKPFARSAIFQQIRLELIALNAYQTNAQRDNLFTPNTDYFYNIHYIYKKNTVINPQKADVYAQYGNAQRYVGEEPAFNFIKCWGDFKQTVNYNVPKKYLTLRLFGGAFLYKSDNTINAPADFDFHADGGAGYNDYTYSTYFADRTAQTGFWAHQILDNDGAMKVRTDQNTPYGLSNTWMTAFNATSSLPFIPWFKLFTDIATYGKVQYSPYEYVSYDGGIMLDMYFFKVYYPFIFSKDLNTNIIKPEFKGLNKLMFSINLDNFRILDQAKTIF